MGCAICERMRPLALLPLVFACGVQTVGDREDPPPPPGPVALNDSTPLLRAEFDCRAMDGELLSVGPEGDAWIWTESGITVLRSGAPALEVALPPGEITFAHALNDRELVAIADGRLWLLSDEGTAPIHFPIEGGTPLAFCGDPRRDLESYVLASGGLHERSSERWWHLDPAGPAMFERLRWLANHDGSCAGAEGHLYMAGDHVWRLSDEGIQRLDELSTPSLPPVRHHEHVAVAAGRVVHLGNPEVGFGEATLGAPVRHLASGGGTLWVGTEDALPADQHQHHRRDHE